MLRLIDAWDPIAYTDLHVTDGAKFQHDVSITVEPTHSGDSELRQAGIEMRDPVNAKLTAQGSKTTRVLSLVCWRRRPGIGVRGWRADRALLAWLHAAAQSFRRAGGNPFMEGLSNARAHHPQHDRRVARPHRWQHGGEWLEASRTRADGTRDATGRTDCSARLQGDGRIAPDRLPRLCLHAHAVGRVGRVDDALRRKQTAGLAYSAARRRRAERHRSSRQPAVTSCPPRTPAWVAAEKPSASTTCNSA